MLHYAEMPRLVQFSQENTGYSFGHSAAVQVRLRYYNIRTGF